MTENKSEKSQNMARYFVVFKRNEEGRIIFESLFNKT